MPNKPTLGKLLNKFYGNELTPVSLAEEAFKIGHADGLDTYNPDRRKGMQVTATIDENDVLGNLTDEQIRAEYAERGLIVEAKMSDDDLRAECTERGIQLIGDDLPEDYADWIQKLREAARADISTCPGIPLEQISKLHKVVADFIAEATGQIL